MLWFSLFFASTDNVSAGVFLFLILYKVKQNINTLHTSVIHRSLDEEDSAVRFTELLAHKWKRHLVENFTGTCNRSIILTQNPRESVSVTNCTIWITFAIFPLASIPFPVSIPKLWIDPWLQKITFAQGAAQWNITQDVLRMNEWMNVCMCACVSMGV